MKTVFVLIANGDLPFGRRTDASQIPAASKVIATAYKDEVLFMLYWAALMMPS